jgi:hypothetical protein
MTKFIKKLMLSVLTLLTMLFCGMGAACTAEPVSIILIEKFYRPDVILNQQFDVIDVLENYNAKIDDHVVLKRESWWKEAVQTRRFGYNSN